MNFFTKGYTSNKSNFTHSIYLETTVLVTPSRKRIFLYSIKDYHTTENEMNLNNLQLVLLSDRYFKNARISDIMFCI